MFIFKNPNPGGSYVGDCVIRAISIATNKSWYDTFIGLCLQGFIMHDMPSSNRVWNEYLKKEGYTRHVVPDNCPDCYTVRDFCGEYFKGTYILGTGKPVEDVWLLIDELIEALTVLNPRLLSNFLDKLKEL